MVSLRRTYLLFMLSSVVFVEISHCACCSCICEPLKRVGYTLASPAYLHHYLCNKGNYTCCGVKGYINRATDDDIKKEKYIFIDMLSIAHHHAILKLEEGDIPEERRTSVTTYKVDPEVARASSKFLTIGDVKFYKRNLQGNLEYYDRIVTTYWDENNKFCILIESFDNTGLRTRKRIYRNDWTWWKQRIVDEKVSPLSCLTKRALTSVLSKSKENLKLSGSHQSQFTRQAIFNGGMTHYNYPKGKYASRIDCIEFGSTKAKIKDKTEDFYVWHFYTRANSVKVTSLVVLYERTDKQEHYTYYKCLDSSAERYEVLDSVVDSSDHIKLSNSGNVPTQRTVTSIDWEYKLQDKLDVHAERMTIHVYPESNHFTIRPSALNNPNIIKSVKIKDIEEQTLPCDSELFTHLTLQGIQRKSRRFSVVSFNNSDFSLKSMKFRLKEADIREEYFYDIHTAASLSHRIPLYYLSSSVFGLDIIGDKYKVTIDGDDKDVFTAKLNDNTTFYGSNLTVYKTLSNVKWEDLLVDVGGKIHSQVLHCETGGSEFIVILQPQRKPLIYKKDNGKLVKQSENQHNTLLKGANIEFLLERDKTHSWQKITLDLSDRIIPDGVEVFLPSADCVLYKTSYGRTINKILWKRSTLDIPKGWTQVSRLTYGDYIFILVDLITNSDIIRQLYELDGASEKLHLLSCTTIQKNTGNLDTIKNKIDTSLIDLIPETLGVNINFDDSRLYATTVLFDSQKIMYSDPHSRRSVGYLKVGNHSFDLEPKHMWRQAFKVNAPGENVIPYRIFTLTTSGITEHNLGDKMTTNETAFDKPIKPLGDNTIPLLIDSVVLLPNINRAESKLGSTTIVTYKSKDNGKVLNPVVFGRHEIKLLKNPTNVNVTTSYSNTNLRQVTIEVTLDKKVTLNFTQESYNSEVYILKAGGDKDAYVDLNAAANLDKDTHAYDSIDFNTMRYPNNVKYLTLSKELVYFTGVTRCEKFSVKAGDHVHTIDKKGIRYHIWMKYPYGNVSIANMLVAYVDSDKLKESAYDLKSSEEAKKLKRPDCNFDWGVLTRREAVVVNQNLLSMVNHEEDFFPVDLSLPLRDGDNTIFKLQISDKVSVYTVPANKNYIINDVKYKNAVIKGTEKQIVKYVYHSEENNEDIILIVTKTISRLLINAYSFGQKGHFEEIDINTIHESHSELTKFKTKVA